MKSRKNCSFRTYILMVAVVLLLTSGLVAAEKTDWYKKARQQAGEKNYTGALESLEKGLAESPKNKRLINARVRVLISMDRHDDALAATEQAIKDLGEDSGLYSLKYDVLSAMKKHGAAIGAILKSDELAKRKRPWPMISAAESSLRLKDKDSAYKYLDKAVERNFISYKYLLDEENENHQLYRAIRNEPRFAAIIKKINDKVGINQPARDFTVKLLDGKDFTLSNLKGKVVLVDFWATWCPPCREEIPNLREYYAELKSKGFEIIGISLDTKEEKLTQYIDKEKMVWPISYTGDGWGDQTVKLYGVNSIPSYWLVDKKGVLRHFDLRKEKMKQALIGLLAEK